MTHIDLASFQIMFHIQSMSTIEWIQNMLFELRIHSIAIVTINLSRSASVTIG